MTFRTTLGSLDLGSGILCLCIAAATGCTHLQLQKNTNRQAKSLSATYEEQVLDNLAMFVSNPHATPFFAVPDAGTNQVSDTGKLAAGAGAFTLRFWKFISADETRYMNQSWTLKPVVDPVRLRLMQCAYQRAVGLAPNECQPCCELEKAWYGPKYKCDNPCGITCGWVRSSDCWRDVPKCCCTRYGYHCGRYVWADPCYQHEFSKLVLKIVEYASGAKAGSTKEVRFYLNADGSPGNSKEHAASIFATVGSGQTLEEIERDLKIFQAPSTKKRIALEKLLSETIGLPPATEANKNDLIGQLNRAWAATPSLALNTTNMSATDSHDTIETQRQALIAGLRGEIEGLKETETKEIQDIMNAENNSAYVYTEIGPPTQSNGNGNLLDLQQRLNTVAPPRN